jgi:hypothetical protein
MSYENIRIDTPGFCCAGGYFYTMKPAPSNMLIQKTGYGDPVMTYPFSNEIDLTSAGTSFLSLQYDGINFWSLEKRLVNASIETERILRRWRIEDFMCVLKDSWRIRGQGSGAESMTGKAFAIENYQNTLAEACGPGTSNLDRMKMTYPIGSFFHVTDQLHLHSATQDYGEDIPVATILDQYTVTFSQPIQSVYYAGDKVSLRRDLYYFNNASPAQGSSSAAVYWYAIPHITAADPAALNEPTYKGCHDSGIYDQTLSATFVTVSGLDGINQGCYAGLIAYVRGQQLLFKRPNLPADSFTYPGPNSAGTLTTGFDYVGTNTEIQSNVASMIMDNAIKTDKVTLWTIYDLCASIDQTTCLTVNIYRLQTGYTYGTQEGSFSTGPYNYVVSIMKPMVTSIALTAEPALVVANGVDKSLIYATVRDQYGAALNYKRVVFGLTATDSAALGYFLCPEDVSECVAGSFTWLDGTPHAQAEIITGSQSSYPGGPPALGGQAVIEWRAGTKAGLITILAIVQP